MKPDNWEEMNRLMELALERASTERAAFLAEACAGDETLRQKIELLLPKDDLAQTVTQETTSIVGQKLGHYQVLSQLGAGGMGEVYLALDARLGRKVALKVLPARFTSDPNRLRRFEQEGRAASALNHPNIVTIHDIGQSNGVSFITTELVEGQTLRGQLADGPVRVRAALHIVQQVAAALSAAHAAGIIHRDIKPENIMLRRDGLVKVLDFGLAKLTEALSDSAEIDVATRIKESSTATGTILGTAQYMSPEQARGLKLDERTDIFSLGVVLYEMIVGKSPFRAATMADTLAAILHIEPPPLTQLVTEVPSELDLIVGRALSKDREQRYQTSNDLRNDLRSLSENPSFDAKQKQRSQWNVGFESQSLFRTSAVPKVRGGDERESTLIKVPPRVHVESSSSGEVTSAIGGTSIVRRSKWRSLLHSRSMLVVSALLVIVAAATTYFLLIQGPAHTQPTGSESAIASAYDDYLRGRVIARSQNRENNAAAIKLLEGVTRADPTFAPAYVELARAYNIKAFYLATPSEQKQLNLEAKVAVEKALSLNPNLAEAHSAQGFILWTHAEGFPHEQAIQAYQRALSLDPNQDEVHHQLGTIYLHIGLLDKAWGEIEKGVAINPANTLVRFRFGVVNIYRGRYEESLAILKNIPRDANPSLVDRNLSTALFKLGRMEEAAAVVEENLKAYTADEGGAMTSVKAMLFAHAGRATEAEVAILRAIEIGKGFGHFHHTAYNIASAYAILNRPNEAIKWLQEAADDGFPCYPWFERDSSLNNLRKDGDFIILMSRLRKQWEHYKSIYQSG